MCLPFKLLGFAAFCFFQFKITSAKNQYLIYVPKFVHPGQPINYVVHNLIATEDVLVTGILTYKHGTLSTNSIVFQGGENKMLSTEKLPLTTTRKSGLKLKITGRSRFGEILFTDETSNFRVKKYQSMIIQTDKSAYKPGQIVKFRIINLDVNLKPLTHKLNYEITDSKSNVILLKENQVPTLGVVSDELQIYEDSPAGDWTIKATDHITKYRYKVKFQVKTDKLPRFEVMIKAPNYYYLSSDGLTVKLQANYEEREKKVSGKALIEVALLESRDDWRMNYYDKYYKEDLITSVKEEFANFTGEAQLFVDSAKLGSFNIESVTKCIVVFASVTELNTTVELNTTRRIDIEDQPIKIKKLFSSKIAKPGLQYFAYFKISEIDGNLIQDSFRQRNQLSIKATIKKFPNPIKPIEPIEPISKKPRVVGPPSAQFTTQPPPKGPHENGPSTPLYNIIDDGGLTYGADGWMPGVRKPTQVTNEEPTIRNYEISPDGRVAVNLNLPEYKFYGIDFQAYIEGTDVGELNWSVSTAESRSYSFIQIISPEIIFEGKVANFTVISNKVIEKLQILIKSKGNILSNEQVTYDSNSKSVNFELLITRQMSPSATILVSYVRQDGEIVADYITITVGVSLENKVLLQTSADSVDAGSNIQISVQTSEGGSLVGLQAIDKSVLLMKDANEVSINEITRQMLKYSGGSKRHIHDWWPRTNEGSTATSIFQSSSMNVLTDAYIHEKKFTHSYLNEYYGVPYLPFSYFPRHLKKPRPQIFISNSLYVELKKPRMVFPATWLWKETISNNEGLAVFNVTVPDTITSWVLNAFSVSENYGLGVATSSQITVSRNFFINLNVPLKVIRGEIVIIQAIIFNYFKMDLMVDVRLHNENGFELIMPVDDEAVAGRNRRIKIRAEDQYSISFPLKMNQIGEIDIQVSASSVVAADSLIRKISVKPEGLQQCSSQSVLLRRDSRTNEDSVKQLNVQLPSEFVLGSESVKMFVFGSSNQDLVVTVTKDHASQNITILANSRMGSTRIDLPATNGEVNIEASAVRPGTWLASAIMYICYNIVESPSSISSFDCNLEFNDQSIDFANMTLCCSLKTHYRRPIGMVLYQINLPSGFKVNLDEEITRNREANLVELKQGSVNYHYELFRRSKNCATTQMKRYQQVANNKPLTIKVQDSYQSPDKSLIKSYSVPSFEEVEICELCGSKCAGCPESILSEWKLLKPCLSSCDEDFEELYRDCIDPIKNEIIDSSFCGFSAKPFKRVLCQTPLLPECPTKHLGILEFYDMYEGYPITLLYQNCGVFANSIFNKGGFSEPKIPSVRFQGAFSCPFTFENFIFSNGFTISILMYMEHLPLQTDLLSYEFNKLHQYQPFFKFLLIKSHDRNGDFLKFEVIFEDTRYTTHVSQPLLPLHQWTHLLITWHPNRHSVYINGKKSGKEFVETLNTVQELYRFRARFRVGGQNIEKDLFRGNATSIGLWNRNFNDDEALQTYNFYEEILITANNNIEPILKPYMQKHLFSFSLSKDNSCFSEAATLSQLLNSDSCFSKMNP